MMNSMTNVIRQELWRWELFPLPLLGVLSVRCPLQVNSTIKFGFQVLLAQTKSLVLVGTAFNHVVICECHDDTRVGRGCDRGSGTRVGRGCGRSGHGGTCSRSSAGRGRCCRSSECSRSSQVGNMCVAIPFLNLGHNGNRVIDAFPIFTIEP